MHLRRFLWGGGSDQKKIAWIRWETVCLPKERGCLGMKDISTFNLALLGKWKWHLLQNQGELWARVLESKYGGGRGLEEEGRAANESSIWWETLSWMNISSVLPLNPRCHFLQHSFVQVAGIRVKRWQCWWVVVMRNKIVFSNESFNGNKLMEDAMLLTWTWLTNFKKDFTINFNHWSSHI
ncbi:putative ribonuclease H protein [Glycine soja]